MEELVCHQIAFNPPDSLRSGIQKKEHTGFSFHWGAGIVNMSRGSDVAAINLELPIWEGTWRDIGESLGESYAIADNFNM